MLPSFTHDIPSQRVVFAPGAVARVADEAARLEMNRALVIATPGSGAVVLPLRTSARPRTRAARSGSMAPFPTPCCTPLSSTNFSIWRQGSTGREPADGRSKPIGSAPVLGPAASAWSTAAASTARPRYQPFHS